MIRRLVVALMAATVSLTGCGVSTQDEPERLPTSSPTVAPTTPQVTHPPNPSATTTTSTTPTPLPAPGTETTLSP